MSRDHVGRKNLPRSYKVGFSDDGRLIATLSRRVSLFDVASGRELWSSHPFSHPSHISFSADGRVICVKSTSGRIVTLDGSNGEVIFDFENQSEGEGGPACFSPCGKFLVDSSWNGLVTVRDAANNRVEFREQFTGEMISGLSCDRSHNRWLFVHTPKSDSDHPLPSYLVLRHWPLSNTEAQIFRRGAHLVRAILSPSGSRIAFLRRTASYHLDVFEIAGAHLQSVASKELEPSSNTLELLCWSYDEKYLGLVQPNSVLVLSAQNLSVLAAEERQYASSMAFSPDGVTLVMGWWGGGQLVTLAALGIASA